MLQGKDLIFAIVSISLITFLTRAFPFILFGKKGSKPPEIIMYLGKYLPPAIISCILVYCFRATDFTKAPFGFREIISSLIIVLIYHFKKNAMAAILSGTFVYVIFTNFLFNY